MQFEGSNDSVLQYRLQGQRGRQPLSESDVLLRLINRELLSLEGYSRSREIEEKDQMVVWYKVSARL